MFKRDRVSPDLEPINPQGIEAFEHVDHISKKWDAVCDAINKSPNLDFATIDRKIVGWAKEHNATSDAEKQKKIEHAVAEYLDQQLTVASIAS